MFSVPLFARKSWNYLALRLSLIPNTSRATRNPMSRLGGKERGNVGTAWCQAEILHPSCCVPLGESFNHSYPWPPLLENGGRVRVRSGGSEPVIPSHGAWCMVDALWSVFLRSCPSEGWPQRKMAWRTSPRWLLSGLSVPCGLLV